MKLARCSSPTPSSAVAASVQPCTLMMSSLLCGVSLRLHHLYASCSAADHLRQQNLDASPGVKVNERVGSPAQEAPDTPSITPPMS